MHEDVHFLFSNLKFCPVKPSRRNSGGFTLEEVGHIEM